MPQLLKRLARAAVVLSILLGITAAPAAADVRLLDAYAGPVTKESACTAEPAEPYWSEGIVLPWTPAQYGVPYPYGAAAAPDIADGMVPSLQAGAATDYCVAFRVTPHSSGLAGTTGTGIYSGRVLPYSPLDPLTHPTTGDDLRELVVDLPAGFLSSLAGKPRCTAAQFTEELPNGANLPAACPAGSRVGGVGMRVTTLTGSSTYSTHAVVPAYGMSDEFAEQQTANDENGEVIGYNRSNSVYLLERRPGELATLGLDLYVADAVAYVRSRVGVRLKPDGSGRLQAVTDPLPRVGYRRSTVTGLMSASSPPNAYVESVGMTIWGAAAHHPEVLGTNDVVKYEAMPSDFAESGTSCAGPSSATLTATTYGNSTQAPADGPVTSSLTRSFQLTGCDQLEFHPGVSVTTTERTPGTPTGATIRVNLGQATSNGLRTALLKDAVVTLPDGLDVGGQAATDADSLTFCAPADFAKDDTSVASACPTATEAATVGIVTPLLDEGFDGKAWLGEPVAGSNLPTLYVEATLAGATEADAPRIKLVGRLGENADGQLTTTFTDAPQLRFSQLTLTFPGGDHALFVTPPRCGTTTGTARMTPWSGQPASEVPSSLTIDQGCDAGFAPKVTVEPLDPRAGKKGSVRITIERESNEPWLENVNVHLPSGFLADLNAAKECPVADAAVGNCSADSQIGTVQVLAGGGPAPLPLDGKMYLAERQGSDVAGAVIVTDAQVGDLDLGKVIVPGRILLRPTDAGLDFIADVPLRVQGVALQLQKVVVTLDRQDFALNPSACGPLGFDAEITGDAGETAKPSGTVSYTGCKELPFAPKLQAILTGDNTPGGHPGMFVVLTSPEGDAGMKSAVVTLPDGVVVDLQNAKNSCSTAQFNASACPASARIGTAKAQVSIIPEELTGAIYLVEIAGKSLPGLGLDFGGRYAQRVLGTTATNKDNRVVTSFASIPDLPLRRLTIDVTSSPRSPLQVSETSPCDANSGWEGAFTAQGGQSSTGRSGLQCAAKPKTLLSSKSGLSFRLFDFGTRNLSYLKLALPKGWSFNAKAAKRPDALWVRTTGGTATIKLAKRSLFVYATGKTTDVRFKISRSVINAPRKIKRGTKVNLPVRLAFTDGTIQQQTASITLR